MIARLLLLGWVAMLCAVAAVAWLANRGFGDRIGPWAASLAGAALVLAAHPALIAFNFVVARLRGDRVPLALRLDLRQSVAMLDGEIDASVRGFWFAAPFRAAEPAARPAPGTPLRALPILFVHGYLCNRAVWLSFMSDAASRGYLCAAPTLRDPFDDIERHATTIERAIDELLAEAADRGLSATSVAVVAHSMGGLVIRSALQRIDPSRVARVVTLGTPHRGTFSAHFGRFPSVVQMRPRSEWLARLGEAERAGRGLGRDRCTSVYSVHDEIVYPQETGGLEGSERVAIGGVGHVALLYHPKVRAIVFERLDQAAATAAS